MEPFGLMPYDVARALLEKQRPDLTPTDQPISPADEMRQRMTPRMIDDGQASLSVYHPTVRDKVASILGGGHIAERLTNSRGAGSSGGFSPLDLVPGVGQLAQAEEGARAGDPTSVAMAAMPGSKGGGRVMKEASDLGSAPFSIGPPAARGKAPIRSTELQNIRELPVDEAIAVARKEPHLIKAGDQSEGYYVGGARDLTSKRSLTNLRKRFDDYVAADPRGGDWYDRYRNSIKEVTGDIPSFNKWMANQEGQWSAGVSPDGELGFALKENNASIAGMPVKAARPAQHEAHLRAVASGDPSQYQLGAKTGEYASLINPDRPRPAGATGVNDFRHARNFDYTEAKGGDQKNALTAAQHRFLDHETALAVDRANKSNLGGRSDWTGEQLQAAPWVRQKALDIQSRNPKLTYDEAFARANTTIGDFFDKHTAFATHEAMPGANTGHLPFSIGAPDEARAAFSKDPRSSWANAPGGRDAIYAGMGVEGTGNFMRVRPSKDMQGLYTTPQGVVETNPGQTARPLVAFDSGNTKTVSPADQALLNAGEATRGYVDAQNAAAWHKPWVGGAPGESQSLFYPMKGPATKEQLLEVQAATSKHGLPDVADSGQGITATRFWPSPDGDIGKPLRKGDLNIAGMGDPVRTKIDSNLIDYVPSWEKGVGSGEATKELLTHVNRTPEIKAAMNNNPYIPQNALARLERDKDWSKQWGATREDIQNARQIIGEGPGWVDRLEAALKKGAILPAVAGAIFAAGQQAPQGEGL